MPTYQYACTSCSERREVVQRMTDAPLTTCEACGGTLRKVLYPVGVVFKGSGFYRTDSRGKASTNGSKGEHKNGDDTAAKDTKPDKSGSDGKSSADSSSTSTDTSSTSSSNSAKPTTASKAATS